jgi:hypothetical protein
MVPGRSIREDCHNARPKEAHYPATMRICREAAPEAASSIDLAALGQRSFADEVGLRLGFRLRLERPESS